MHYINHITLNTGHVRKTYPHEINKELYFVLKRLYKDIFEHKAVIYEGYTAEGTYEPNNGAIITVYGPQGEPVLTTGITRDKGSSIWELMHSTSAYPLATKPNSPPKTPFIADRIEVGAITNMDALQWTGDFSKCMGWICLAPEKIR